MEPLGHIAGSASAVIGSLTLFISLLLGTLIGQAYDGTVVPEQAMRQYFDGAGTGQPAAHHQHEGNDDNGRVAGTGAAALCGPTSEAG